MSPSNIQVQLRNPVPWGPNFTQYPNIHIHSSPSGLSAYLRQLCIADVTKVDGERKSRHKLTKEKGLTHLGLSGNDSSSLGTEKYIYAFHQKGLPTRGSYSFSKRARMYVSEALA